MNLGDPFSLGCALVGLLTLIGVVLASRGHVFEQKTPGPESGPYREATSARTPVETPRDVRAIGIVSVLFGVASAFVLAPAGALGALLGHDLRDDFERSMAYLLGVVAATGLVLGITVAVVGVRITRGRSLGAAPYVAVAWIVHHLLVSAYFFASGLHRWDEEVRCGPRSYEPAGWVLAGLVVLWLGAGHAYALYAAARRMRTITTDATPPAG